MRSRKLLALACLAASLTSSSYAAESAYNYQLIAQTGVKIDGITLTSFETMAMNDFDTIVFDARYNDGSYAGAAGIFTRKHALLKKGDVVRGLTVNQPAIQGINDFNELLISFSYGLGFPTALGKFALHNDKIVPEGKLIKIGDVIDGLTIQSFRQSYIDDLGNIVFSADYSVGAGPWSVGVFTSNHVLLKLGSVVDGAIFGQTYLFNKLYGVSDTGKFVFDAYGYVPAQAQTLFGAFTRHKILGITGQSIDGLNVLQAYSPAISHFGRVVFAAEYALTPNCNSYLCSGFAAIDEHGVVMKTGDTIDGNLLINSVAPVAINDQGVVLVQANVGGGYGLFTRDHAVVVTGDKIAGLQVEGFFNVQMTEFGDVGVSAFNGILLAKHKEDCKRK